MAGDEPERIYALASDHTNVRDNRVRVIQLRDECIVGSTWLLLGGVLSKYLVIVFIWTCQWSLDQRNTGIRACGSH